MALKDSSPLGLTFGQLLSLAGLVIALGTAWVSLSTDMADIKARVLQGEKDRERLEKNQTDFILENRAEHQSLMMEIKNNNTEVLKRFDELKTWR